MKSGEGNYQDLLDAAELAQIFPGVTGQVRITSPNSLNYNCLSWVVGEVDKWFDPTPHCVGYHWPSGVEREWTISTIRKLLALYGFTENANDTSLEAGFIKVAFYVDESGEPTHFARQLPNGKWTSKLGELYDVEHDSAENLECLDYGKVHVVVKMKVRRPVC